MLSRFLVFTVGLYAETQAPNITYPAGYRKNSFKRGQ